MLKRISPLVAVVCFALLATPSFAAVIHDESVDGDLGAISSPTSLVLGLGDNEIIGEIGLPGAGVQADAFEIVLGGLSLIAIEVLGIEIDSGLTVRFSNCIDAVGVTCAFSANENAGTGLNVGDVGDDLLADLLAVPPLGAITNFFELTESEGPSRYRLNFITARSTIPEPGTLALFGLGLAGFGFARRRKQSA